MLVDYEFYTSNGYSKLDVNNATQYLLKAERQINTICLNRLYDGTFDKLKESIQHIVKIIICEHAEYIQEYGDAVNGMLKSYSNGSAKFTFSNNTASITKMNNINILSDLYSELISTGLCYRGLC